MSKSDISRRAFHRRRCRPYVANLIPGTTPFAHAASMEERTVTAAKAAGAADVNGMIWSPYLVPMQPVIAEFTKQTGIGVGARAGHLDLRRTAAGDGGSAVALAAVRLHPHRFQHDPVAGVGRISRAARSST